MFGRKPRKNAARRGPDLLHDIEALDGPSFAAFVNDFLKGPLARRHRTVFWGDRMLTLDKSAVFREDPPMAEALAAIHGSIQYDQYGGADSISWRLHTLAWAARRGLRLPGDFIECGVFKGDMSWALVHALRFAETSKTFFLFDTFEGFSPAYSTAQDFPEDPGFLDHAHGIYHGQSDYRTVVERFRPYPNVRVIQGVVPDSLISHLPDAVAFLHLDMNSPSAEAGALEVLFDRISPGAAIVLDDYGWQLFGKQRDAANAFFAAHGLDVLELPTGQGLVVKT